MARFWSCAFLNVERIEAASNTPVNRLGLSEPQPAGGSGGPQLVRTKNREYNMRAGPATCNPHPRSLLQFQAQLPRGVVPYAADLGEHALFEVKAHSVVLVERELAAGTGVDHQLERGVNLLRSVLLHRPQRNHRAGASGCDGESHAAKAAPTVPAALAEIAQLPLCARDPARHAGLSRRSDAFLFLSRVSMSKYAEMPEIGRRPWFYLVLKLVELRGRRKLIFTR